MATDPPAGLVFIPISGRARTVREWLTTFHLLFVAVNPDGLQSRWIVPTAARVLSEYEQADCRVAWLVTGDAGDARRLLGRCAGEIMTFVDLDLVAVKSFVLTSLPAFVHLNTDLTVVNAVQGWDPPAWRVLTT